MTIAMIDKKFEFKFNKIYAILIEKTGNLKIKYNLKIVKNK